MSLLETDTSALSTAPVADAPDRVRPGRGAAVRRSWRQLTSMRTALLLLFLLAVAAVPGSVLPQRGLNPLLVADYFRAHPRLSPWLDRLSLFDVFGAPWFAAIYLLLFISLIGCLLARIRLHGKALLGQPPAVPRHLNRLAHSASHELDTTPEEAAAAIRRLLRRGRWRVVARDEPDGTVGVSAEKGYLRETGNLLFHLALVALLTGIAAGALFGWSATILLSEGAGFCDSVNQYDSFQQGRLVGSSGLPPLCVQLDSFTAAYQADTSQPRDFLARIRFGNGNGNPAKPYALRVNHPLRRDGLRLYLLGHGFTPLLTVRDGSGQTFRMRAPFLPNDANLSSTGAVKLPDARPRQIGIDGSFVPTLDPTDPYGIRSLSARPFNPALGMRIYEGDLGLDTGAPQSVYSLDPGQIAGKRLSLTRLADGQPARVLLRPGQFVRLHDGTTVRFDGYAQWANLRVAHDPGQLLVLAAATAMVAGLLLSLTVRRRRIWFRCSPPAASAHDGAASANPHTVVTVGGLTRHDSDSFEPEFQRLVAAALHPPKG